MSKQLNLQKFNDTPVIKKLKESESSEPVKRGRKAKYATDEERTYKNSSKEITLLI